MCDVAHAFFTRSVCTVCPLFNTHAGSLALCVPM